MVLKNKKAFAPILLYLLLVGGALILIGVYGFKLDVGALTGSGEYIERPIFHYVKCEAIGSLSYSEYMNVATDGQWLNKPSVTNSYNYDFKVSSTSTLSTSTYAIYSICNSKVNQAVNCRVYNQAVNKLYTGATFSIKDVKPTEYVFATFKSIVILKTYNSPGLTYQVSFIPYGLRDYNVLSGSSNPINKNDCSISSTGDSWKDRFLSSNSQAVSDKISKNVNELTLQPEEVRWYVAGYVTSAAPSFKLTYKNQDAWCRSTGTSAEIYKINTVTLGSGTYKIASPDWSDYLGSENCCPGETKGNQVCSKNFKFETIQGSECGAFKSCGSPNWIPYSENKIIKYSCVNGYCKSQTKDVGCANSYDCKDSNEICDLNTFTCERANVNLKGQVIETIPDNSADCEVKNGKWITKQSSQKSFWNYLGIGSPKVIVTEYCDLSKPNYILWIGLILVGIAILVFGKPIFMYFKMLARRWF